MSNRSMPGLVKVGFSTKDPDLRAQELNHTGTPHPYVVDYEALVHDPFEVEQEAHSLLRAHREGKEWFRCSAEEAITALKKAVGDSVLHEAFRKADRAVVDAKRAEERLKTETERKQRELEAAAKTRLDEKVSAVRARYEPVLNSLVTETPFWQYWLGGSFIARLGLAMVAPNMKVGAGFILSALLGAVIGAFIQSGSEERQKKKPKYLETQAAMEAEINAILAPRTNCPSCNGAIAFDAVKIAMASPGTRWQCPKCKSSVAAP